MSSDVGIAIVGSGFAGLGAAIQLRLAGIDDFVILERAGTLGGVWRDNVYPGCACDVESHLYQFSFAPNPDWTEKFSGSKEIWAYLERCATDFQVRPRIRFHHDVLEAHWDDGAAQWRLETTQGRVTADFLVSAVGALAEPAIPSLPGLDSFQGPVFHSARWDPKADLKAKRVAVVGTGASAVQIVPAIQPVVSRLLLFQRTPAWVVPRRNQPIPPWRRAWFRRIPLLERATRGWTYLLREMLGFGFRHPGLMKVLQRLAERHLQRSITDPGLRARLTPTFTLGCKRILVSDDYYPALAMPNVDVIAGPVTEIRLHGVIGPDGIEHPADAIILCTGFEVTNLPFSHKVHGRNGRTLAEAWSGSPQAHLGTTVHGFPNLFLLQGPNTGLGHSSVVLMAEAQIEHVVAAVRYAKSRGIAAVEPTEPAQRAFVAESDRRMRHTVWMQGGCRSWYLDSTGRNSTLWPGTPAQFRRRVAPFRAEEYHLR